MANLLIAITTLAISAVLISFGAYQGHYSMKRTEYATRIGSTINNLVVYVRQSKDDLGRNPASSDLVASRFTSVSGNGLTFSAGNTASYSYVCASASSAQGWMVEAMQRVKDGWPTGVIGSSCDDSTGPGATTVTLTVRIS